MSPTAHRILFWLPRVLSVCIVLFISMFALDVFGEHSGFWETTLAFLIHLIPTFILTLAVIVAWRWEWVGGLLFIVAGIGYWMMVPQRPDWILLISGPLFLIGAMFLWGYVVRTRNHPANKTVS